MSYEPLHHKYRPQTFADLVGQEAITVTLINAIDSQRIAPAYLFTGPRGTGKTSSARILAKSLNCQAGDKPTPKPCGKCEVCRAITRGNALDVIEIDAASNTGVDNIREIIERAQFSPVQCRYKVYVIDECHMLSTAAFNALLKTLEEPPNHVIFVLATTDPQRVLPTIISRCQRFDYRRIPLDAMVAHLKMIAQKESINITDEAITLVGQIANGGLRDAESLLDQLSLLADTVTPEKVWDLVGAVPEKDLLTLLKAIDSDKAETVIDCCRHLMNRGREPLVVLQNLAGFYLNLLIAKTAPNRPDMVAVTSPTWQALCTESQRWDTDRILRGQQHLKDSEVQIKNTTQPRLWLEVTLLGLLPAATPPQQVIIQQQIPSTPATPSREIPPSIPPQTTPTYQPYQPPSPPPEAVKTNPIQPETIASEITLDSDASLNQIWQAILDNLTTFSQPLFRPHCHLIILDENVAIVGIKNEQLLKQAEKKKSDLESTFEKVCQRKIKVKFQVGNSDTATNNNSKKNLNQSTVIPPQNPVSEIVSQPQSPPTIISQPTVNNNGNQAAVKPQPLPEYKKIEHSPDIKNNQVSFSPTDKLTPISENNGIKKNNYSEDEISQAVTSIVDFFEGVIVDLDDQFEEEETQVIQVKTDFNESNKTEQKVLLDSHDTKEEITTQTLINSPPIILNRPDVPDNIDDEDEIPF